MYWQDEKDGQQSFQVPENVVDLLFRLDCKHLPLDHGYALSQAVQQEIPWISSEPQAGIHQIHVAESAHGWMRPDDPDKDLLWLPKRTRLKIRLPAHRLKEIVSLIGRTLDVDGHPLTVGEFTTKKLSKLTTIFCRYIDTEGLEDEVQFLKNIAMLLNRQGINIKKMMSGKLARHKTPDETILTRKLMLSDLDVKQSIQLQEDGLGNKKLLGLGIFMPHKGIDAVNKG